MAAGDSSSKKTIGDENMISWGAPDEGKYGEIQSMTQKEAGDQHPFRDHDGAVKTVVITDIHTEIEIEVLAKKGVTLPKVGDQLTGSFGFIDGTSTNKVYVTNVEVVWSNEDAQKLKVSARDFRDAGSGGSGS